MTKQTLERLIEMQKAIAICECIINDIVEGYIQAVPLAADACIICNEEGKLIGLPYNTRILNEIFVGNILFVGVAGEEFCSLTNEQISLIAERVLNREGN